MAIQSSVPFQLALIAGPEWNQQRLPITRFYDQARLDGMIEPAVVIKENTELAIVFTCSQAGARFYMDGLETLPQGRLAEDASGRSYLAPAGRPIPLFSYIDYPLIPGYYWLEVVVDGQHYFAPLLVEPKRLTRAQWEEMRQELNNELYQLALDLIRQNAGGGEGQHRALPVALLHRFIVIRQHFPAVMAALNDLLTRANYRLQKSYRLQPQHRVRDFDDQSYHSHFAYPAGSERCHSSYAQVCYDLPENRWTKHILRVVSRHLGDFCTAVAAQNTHLAQQIATEPGLGEMEEKQKLLAVLQEYESIAAKMAKAIELLRQATWYEQVGNALPNYHPRALASDARYNALYRLYRELRQAGVAVVLADDYSYQWKRTDQLYELWCFVKLYRALVDARVGFQPQGGWLFDNPFASSTLPLPAFETGAGIVLRREADQVVLHLVYDEELPKQSQETDKQRLPLFTRGLNNRPDGRLDIYVQDIYAGSIIFEFKYRPLHAFWVANAINGTLRPKAMNQLISYANDLRSPYLGLPQLDQRWVLSVSPIHEVWAIFPGIGNGGWHNELHPDHGVRLVTLAPGTEVGNFVIALNDAISTALTKVK